MELISFTCKHAELQQKVISAGQPTVAPFLIFIFPMRAFVNIFDRGILVYSKVMDLFCIALQVIVETL